MKRPNPRRKDRNCPHCSKLMKNAHIAKKWCGKRCAKRAKEWAASEAIRIEYGLPEALGLPDWYFSSASRLPARQ